MTSSIEGQLIQFICSNFMVEPDELNLEDSLVDQGIIDSIGLVEIAAFMKREFDIDVSEENMTRENFGSVKKMVTYIERTVSNERLQQQS